MLRMLWVVMRGRLCVADGWRRRQIRASIEGRARRAMCADPRCSVGGGRFTMLLNAVDENEDDGIVNEYALCTLGGLLVVLCFY
jgi:hypothetical protein